MPVLYVDNFRGFSNTFIPLKQVNFFVGENSSGKTSILKLIHIISEPGFWHYQQFNSNEVSLGNFFEIISFNHRLKEYFDVAVLNDENEFSGIQLRFIESNNYPRLKQLSYFDNKINLQATFEGKNKLKYRYEYNPAKKLGDDLYNYFKLWLADNGLTKHTFITDEAEFLGIRSVLSQLQYLISNRIGVNAEDFMSSNSLRFNLPNFLQNVAGFLQIRAEPRKTYDEHITSFNARGVHTPYILEKSLLSEKSELITFILNRFGGDSGLYEEIQTKKLSLNTENPSPFEILLKINGSYVNIVNVGYGISQVLPLVVEVIARPSPSWFVVQQPEIHLHPRAQAALGDFIFKAVDKDNHSFILETHSDYIIDRFRLRINRALKDNKQNTGDISQVVFFSKKLGENQVEIMDIEANGAYPLNQPSEFKEFFIKEQLELVKI